MKKIFKILSLLFCVLFLSFAACACDLLPDNSTGNDGKNPSDGDNKEDPPIVKVDPIISSLSFEGIAPAADLEQFIREVDKSDGSHDNDMKEVGTIVSPYFEMIVGGKAVECYAVRTTYGAHSFALVDVNDEAFPLSVKLDIIHGAKSVNVLPEKYGVTAALSNGLATAEVSAYGNYTFVVDDNKEKAITLMVRKAEEFAAPEGYSVLEIEPGNHAQKLEFTAEKQVMLFKAGTHYLKYNVEFLDNTQVYLEEGCYIYATMPDRAERPMLDPAWSGKVRWNALFFGHAVENVQLRGRGMIDLSRLDWHGRSAVNFDGCTNVTVEGVTINNSPEWTVYFMYCTEIHVKDVLLFGYRQNSDGICVVDGANALIEDCFLRSGDDLFEVKSMNGNCQIPIRNIVFRKCNAWPDKARGIGIIHESVRDMTDIRFENCSVGYASATWQDQLGSLVLILAGKAKVTDIHYEDIEIYSSALYPINLTIYPESPAQIKNVYFKNIDIRGTQSVRVRNDSQQGGTIENLYFDNCMRDGALIKSYAKLRLSCVNFQQSAVALNKNG